MDSRFRYEVSHVVMNCRDPQVSLRTLRALGACREHGEAGETSTCCCMFVPSRLPNSPPLSFGSNLQHATLSTAFTQSTRSCTRCSAAIPATDFFQGQNQPPLFTPSNRVIMVYSILYISSPTRSRMAPLMGCRLSSIIKANGYQRSFCMAHQETLGES